MIQSLNNKHTDDPHRKSSGDVMTEQEYNCAKPDAWGEIDGGKDGVELRVVQCKWVMQQMIAHHLVRPASRTQVRLPVGQSMHCRACFPMLGPGTTGHLTVHKWRQTALYSVLEFNFGLNEKARQRLQLFKQSSRGEPWSYIARS